MSVKSIPVKVKSATIQNTKKPMRRFLICICVLCTLVIALLITFIIFAKDVQGQIHSLENTVQKQEERISDLLSKNSGLHNIINTKDREINSQNIEIRKLKKELEKLGYSDLTEEQKFKQSLIDDLLKNRK